MTSGTEIPIRNIYYMLAYAWDVLPHAQLTDVAAEECDTLLDLLSVVLVRGIDHILRRGLDREYVEVIEELPGIRGRLAFSESVRTMALVRGRAVCAFDELAHDVLQNQILKTTIDRLIGSKELQNNTREQLAGVRRRLRSISSIRLSQDAFARVRVHRNNRFYGFLLHVCRLVFDASLPVEGGNDAKFRDFVRQRVHELFEKFVLNFYRRRQLTYSDVSSNRLAWADVSCNTADLSALPVMRTDISLVAPDHSLIVDAKFYREALRASRHDGVRKASSSHLYQLYAYLKNLALVHPTWTLDGMLLYPQVRYPVSRLSCLTPRSADFSEACPPCQTHPRLPLRPSPTTGLLACAIGLALDH